MYRRVLGIPFAALWLAACAVPGIDTPTIELPAEPVTTGVTLETIEKAQKLYLYPDRLDRRMLVGALDGLENRFDSIRFVEDPSDGDEPAEFGTLWVGEARARVPIDRDLDAETFSLRLGQVLSFVKQRLPADEIDQGEDSDLELIALRGALANLDRYSTVYSARGSEDFQIRFSGELSGIGCRITRENGKLTALQVFPGPAQEAGLRDGDWIESIDGEPTRAMTVPKAVDRIRGLSGTQVMLGVAREREDGSVRRYEVPIVRRLVNVPTVETRKLADAIGYARIEQVSQSTPTEFRNKVLKLGRIDGLILDLRGNTGGSMRAATELADLFLSGDTIVSIVDRASTKSSNFATATPRVTFNLPIVVLVDQSTASAAEIISGAIAPLDRVTLIGQRTFGKGLLQRLLSLPERSTLKLTVGEYLLSGDRAIHKKGLEPDLNLFAVPKSNLTPLATVPADALPYLFDPDQDDQTPVEVARAMLVEGNDAAIARLRREHRAEIAKALSDFGIDWTSERALRKVDVSRELEVDGRALSTLNGKPTKIGIRVRNPNFFEVPATWVALSGPVSYLDNALIGFGNIPAGGSRYREIEVQPEDGPATPQLAFTASVSSGSEPLQSARIVVPVEPHPPEIEIEVNRLAVDLAEVTIGNMGCCDLARVGVSVPGSSQEVIEVLPAGERRTVELPLGGEVKFIGIGIGGSGVSQRIEVPLPEQSVRIIPPRMRLEQVSTWGRNAVRVDASAIEGLQEGWISMAGQKEVYVAWGGSADGTLSAELDSLTNDVDIITKIETVSGVSLLEFRRLIPERRR